MYTSAMTKQQRLILWVCILASFIVSLDGYIVNVALPAIARDFNAGFVVQQWVVDSYMITLGALMLIAGSLSDIYGRKKIMKIGLIGFGITSLACALAPSSLILIIARGLQGVAGALLIPSALAIIISVFHGSDQAKAIGKWTAWSGTAVIIGPLAGGLLVDSLSWRYIFAINIIPIVVALWLLKQVQMTKPPRGSTRLDITSSILGALGLGGTAFALIEQSRMGWSSPVIYLTLAVGILSLIGFIWQQKRSPFPMMPLHLFKQRNFAIGNISTLAVYAALSLAAFVISIFVQQVGGYSALQAGLAVMPATIIMILLASRFGALADKYGPRLFMAAGPIIAGIGFLSMLRIDASADYLTLLPGVLLFGLGLAITVAPLTSAILGCIDSRESGIGSAVNNVISRIAGLLAVAAIGTIVGSNLTLGGFHRSIAVTAALMLIGGIISAIGIQNSPKATSKEPTA